MLFSKIGVFWNVSTYPKERKQTTSGRTGTFLYAIRQVRVECLSKFPVSPWRIMISFYSILSQPALDGKDYTRGEALKNGFMFCLVY
jgi:hypothetical protein